MLSKCTVAFMEIDLTANVRFTANADGWTLDQATEVIHSVRASVENTTLNVELWGHVTAVSPGGMRYPEQRFHQDCWMNLGDHMWRAQRTLPDVIGDSFERRDGAMIFERSGTAGDVPAARRI